MTESENPVVDAVNDQTRVMIALSGKYASRAEAIRELSELGIPPIRIAAIFAIPPKNVHSVLSRARK